MFNSLLNTELLHGTFKATIESYKEFPALINNTNGRYDTSLPENAIIRDAFLEVTLRLDNNETIKTRWYSKRINYILRCLRNQLGDHIYKLTDALNAASKTPITIHIEIDPKYGQQIDYED